MENENLNTEETDNSDLGAVRASTVKVMIRIIDLYPATPWRTSYEICTQAYNGAMRMNNHKWNKILRRKRWNDAVSVCEKWKSQMKEQGVEYWQQ